VLAVVALGLEANMRRAHISPEVEQFLHSFWEMMAYLTNTVIFTLVGVVIAERAFNDVEPRDWFYLLSLYLGLTVIRLFTIWLMSPLLTRLGCVRAFTFHNHCSSHDREMPPHGAKCTN
jgi:sodium/hydrogen exchanger 10/11